MIALLIALIIAALLFACAYLGTKHPLPSVGRGITAASSLLACIALITGLAFYPSVNVWQQYTAGQATASRYDLERIRAEHMIKLMGSPQAYIEYLKAIQEK